MTMNRIYLQDDDYACLETDSGCIFKYPYRNFRLICIRARWHTGALLDPDKVKKVCESGADFCFETIPDEQYKHKKLVD